MMYLGEAAKLWNNWIAEEKREPQLDPMLTLIELALLAFEDKGTKIGIKECDLEFHPPGLTQGLYRWWTGDKHDELKVLGGAIEKAVFQYKEIKGIDQIFQSAIKGLEKLQETYPNTTVSESAKHWISTLKDKNLEDNPHISETAKKVKKVWKDHQLESFSNWIKDALDALPNKGKSEDAKKKLTFAIQKINDLLNLKKTEFREILVREKGM